MSTDFFKPISSDELDDLVDAMLKAVARGSNMTPIEKAEFAVLEANFKLHGAKVDLIYTQATGEEAPRRQD